MKPTSYRSFAELRSLARATRKAMSQEQTSAALSRPAVDPPQLSEADLFEQSMQDVEPLGWSSIPRPPQDPVEIPNPQQVEDDGLRLLVEFIEGRTPMDLRLSGEYVEGTSHPLGRKLLDPLRSGRFAVEAHLDLHGLSLAEARIQLENFVRRSLFQGYGCVRIVHGRGHHSADDQPVIKEHVQKWLRSRRVSRNVVAFTSACLQDGGGGALYVLLKKS